MLQLCRKLTVLTILPTGEPTHPMHYEARAGLFTTSVSEEVPDGCEHIGGCFQRGFGLLDT